MKRALARPSPLAGLVLILALAPLSGAGAAHAAGDPPEVEPLPVQALTGVRIVVAPGKVIESGTVVIRDGVIEAAGADVQPPPDARVRDRSGLTVYSGLIDPYVVQAWGEEREAGGGAPKSEGPVAPNPMVHAERSMAMRTLDPKTASGLREAGFTTAVVAPREGLLRGSSALVELGDGSPRTNVLRGDVAQNVTLTHTARDGYPDSLMGAIALTRQSFLDAGWYGRAWQAYRDHPSQARPPYDAALEALGSAAAGREPVVFESADLPGDLRAAKIAREMKLDAWLVASGEEYQEIDRVKALGLPLLVPVAFPEPPKPHGDELSVELDELRHWRDAPQNPVALERAGVRFALTSFGLKHPADLHDRLARARDAGLDADAALAALTTAPAELLGLADRMGTIEAGKIANLVVAEGDLFRTDTKVREVWIDGRRYEVSEPEAEAEEPGKQEADSEQAEGSAPAEAEPAPPAEPASEVATAAGPASWARPRPEQPAALLVRGGRIWTSGPQGRLESADLLVRAGKIAAVGPHLAAPPGAVVIDATGKDVTPGLIDCHSHTAISGGINEGSDIVTAEVRIEDVLDPRDVNLYRELAGGLTMANVLHGSANAIGGQNAVIKLRWGAPASELLFDGRRPGIKFALGENPKQSNWNRDEERYPQTRMGVEQAIVSELEAARDYRRKQQEYQGAKNEGAVVPPRRDLRLEAVAEVLDGKRQVHSHAYRADEMLMLLGLSDTWGFEIGAFQHGLEAYKIADELAARGVGVSTFSDWWAYKYEVVDAIPYNGPLLMARGVVTSYNSDDDELARRLNTEAAKAVRYGGVPETEALDLVTINPAKQLDVDSRVGSLEPGKDADFVLWSGDPLSSYAVAEQTWIDGRKYFDRADDLAHRPARAAEREKLLADAEKAAEAEKKKHRGKADRHGASDEEKPAAEPPWEVQP